MIGEITPEGAFNALAIGTAQCVLAMVAVIEFLAIGLMFSIWRKDIATDRENDKENSTVLIDLLSRNSVALSDNAQASHRPADRRHLYANRGTSSRISPTSRHADLHGRDQYV